MLAKALKISVLCTTALFILMIIVSTNTILQYESVLFGMGFGMSTFLLINHVIKKWITKIKVNMMLKDLRKLMDARKKYEETGV